MSLKQLAQETLRILETGRYLAPSGTTIEIDAWQAVAVSGTKTYTPDQLDKALGAREPCARPRPAVEVTSERTQDAAQRLSGNGDVALLNFASARNPGGGFINGASAQEEDLTRCSGLYPCLLGQTDYYQSNRFARSMVYTDHIIYSPGIPFFRQSNYTLLDQPYRASVITAPAPNAVNVKGREHNAKGRVEKALRRRAGLVLLVAALEQHRRLVLGAWGCGVFGNDPALVADAFGRWLEDPLFAGAFDTVVFAILDNRKAPNLPAFAERFADWTR